MNTPTQDSNQNYESEVIGPPAKFDVEPVRRKSRRGLKVAAVSFLLIVCAVGLVGYNVKSILKSNADERAKKQKESSETYSAARQKKTFDLDIPEAAMPVTQSVPPQLPQPTQIVAAPPIPVVTSTEIGSSTQQARPARRSMMVAMPEPAPGLADSDPSTAMASAEAQAQQIAAASGAVPLGSLGQLVQGSAGGGSPSVVNAGTSPRARSVQELAKRSTAAITSTTQALAANLGNRSFLLSRGARIPCTLETQLNSNVPGNTSCITSQDIYSNNGKLVLMERGSRLTGSYGGTLKNGDRRIAVLWNRIETPNGVVVDIDSPATDGVGTSGVDGEINNHWFDRIGAAFLLSLVDDAIQLQTAKEGAQARNAQSNQSFTNGVPFQSTTGTTKSIAEKVLESTINIAPTLEKNRGERLMVMVNRDLWFDNVYEIEKR